MSSPLVALAATAVDAGLPLGRTLAAAALGALAASAADTWATEIGSLATRPPRSILTLRPVPAGTSGGVNLLGMLAMVAGATFVAAGGRALAIDVPAIAVIVGRLRRRDRRFHRRGHPPGPALVRHMPDEHGAGGARLWHRRPATPAGSPRWTTISSI